MKLIRGQVDLGHVLTGLVTTALIGGGAFIWNTVKPEPRADQARAVAEALQAREVVELRRISDEHTAMLKVAMPQLQRIEEAVNDLREARGIRPASGKRP